MKEDHMQDGQLKPVYNATLGTDAGYIVGVHISQERSDSGTFMLLAFAFNINRLHNKVQSNRCGEYLYVSRAANHKLGILVGGKTFPRFVDPKNIRDGKTCIEELSSAP